MSVKNKCKYFRCHELEEKYFNCELCYCPFYDMCKSKKVYDIFGGYILESNGLLACEKCTFFHKKQNVQKYRHLKQKGLKEEEIFDYFVELIKNIES